ncbi:hypothetical protein NPIL_289471 [Nephila pilipes]|uniref:Uncharacterized protein n=1 Tax=Nephila pilipes TaxID=299642 RepID=A0A8X6M8Q3_NEPPI|nr:hypothetical protein NPIL_289471 [Nephila pilipes]
MAVVAIRNIDVEIKGTFSLAQFTIQVCTSLNLLHNSISEGNLSFKLALLLNSVHILSAQSALSKISLKQDSSRGSILLNSKLNVLISQFTSSARAFSLELSLFFA